jgi:hypothetical protein
VSNEATWLLLSFGIMVVAVLAVLHEKLERLEERLRRLEPPDESDLRRADATRVGGHRDRS